jgi:hypothetical protein
MAVNGVVAPALARCTPAAAGEASAAIIRQVQRVTPVLAGLTILFGLALGTVFGPIKSWNYLTTQTYGIAFLVATILSVLVAAWGRGVIEPAGLRIAALPDEAKPAAIRRLALLSGIELLGFLVIFTCMVLMHHAEEMKG